MSTLPIMWRYSTSYTDQFQSHPTRSHGPLPVGMWPILIWMRSDTCHHPKPWVSFLKFEEGMVGSIRCKHWHLGDSLNCFFTLTLSTFAWACCAADPLSGSSCLHILHSCYCPLDFPWAENFTSLSALLFPTIPLCHGVHISSMPIAGCLCWVAAICS